MQRRQDYDFQLPETQIAQAPADRRDGSRLLVLPAPDVGPMADRQFAEVVELLPANALLVVNDTRVFPARLRTRKPTGGAVELLFLERLDGAATTSQRDRADDPGERWRCLARSSKKLRAGTCLAIEGADESVAVVSDRRADGTVVIEVAGSAHDLLERHGEVPLPPYIQRPDGLSRGDIERYQTVYARAPGAVAAPTAGLHFTEPLMAALRQRGVDIAAVTLHVGLGTFAPMRAERLDDHRMHTERYVIPARTAELLTQARAQGRPVVAVGTTCVRALESAALATAATDEVVRAGVWSETDLFIRPGFQFRIVDRLITNFHLPQSTLLMLVCAFAGYQRTMAAYRHAVAAGYRFFSYGDAMLISRASDRAD